MTTALAPLASTTPANQDPARQLLSAFLAGRSPHTLRAYRADLEAFAGHVGAPGADAAVAGLLAGGHGKGNGVALGWRNAMVEAELAPATVNRRLAALRSVVKLARMLGMVNWVLDVEGLEARAYRDTRGPGAEGVRALLAQLDNDDSPKAIRDRALVRCLFDMALRRGELVALDVAHLDLERGKLSIKGKGRTSRESLTVPAPTAAALRAWLDVRGDDPGPLFVALDRASRGKRLQGRGVAVILERLSAAAGVAKVRPHGLRHAGITHALDVTGSTRKAARYSRHRNLDTIEIYDDNRRDIAGEVAALVAMAV